MDGNVVITGGQIEKLTTSGRGVLRKRQSYRLPERTLIREHLIEQMGMSRRQILKQFREQGIGNVPQAAVIAYRLSRPRETAITILPGDYEQCSMPYFRG